MRGIYIITNSKNNKVYIGESLNIKNRWELHIEQLNNNQHHSYKLQDDWNKFGVENFKFEVVEELDKSIKMPIAQFILIAKEDLYIKQYNSIELGYNIQNTLQEILDGKKSILGDIILAKNIKILKNVVDNLNKNNGIYISKESEFKRKLEEKKKQKELENNRIMKTKVILKNTSIKELDSDLAYIKEYDNFYYAGILYDNKKNVIGISGGRFISELKLLGYNIENIKTSKIFNSLLQKHNIIYFEKTPSGYNRALPHNNYIKYCFSRKINNCIALFITNEGKEFLIEKLLKWEYISKNNL